MSVKQVKLICSRFDIRSTKLILAYLAKCFSPILRTKKVQLSLVFCKTTGKTFVFSILWTFNNKSYFFVDWSPFLMVL